MMYGKCAITEYSHTMLKKQKAWWNVTSELIQIF